MKLGASQLAFICAAAYHGGNIFGWTYGPFSRHQRIVASLRKHGLVDDRKLTPAAYELIEKKFSDSLLWSPK